MRETKTICRISTLPIKAPNAISAPIDHFMAAIKSMVTIEYPVVKNPQKHL